MSEHTAETLPKARTQVFRGSIVRTFVLLFIFLALIPATFIGGASYIRYQNSLRSSLSSQIELFGTSYSLQVEQLAAANKSFLNKIATSSTISGNTSSTEYGILRASDKPAIDTVNRYLQEQVDTSSVEGLTEIDIVSPTSGYIYASSNSERDETYLTNDEQIKNLYNTEKTVLLANPGELFPGKLMLVTSKIIPGNSEVPSITILAFSSPVTLSSILTNPTGTYSSAHVFFITSDNKIISINPISNKPVLVKIDDAENERMRNIAATSGEGKEFSYKGFTGINVYSYVKPFKQINAYYFLEVPTLIIENQLASLSEFILVLLGATLVLSATISFIGARQVAVPLVQLSQKARLFAAGDFSQKAQIRRRDEIGQLAQSFNYMVDQLSSFYQSLETRVSDRTRQLQLATEIGQDAISASRVSEMLNRAVKGIVENFDIPYAAIHITDAKRKLITLTEDYSLVSEGLPPRGLQIPLDNSSLIGWVANNDQVRISQEIVNEKPKLSEAAHLQTAQSEIAIPIKVGDRLFGVLNLQSNQPHAFDLDTVPTYTVLANQVATGLRNIELLETTQVSLQESSVLSKFSHDIAQSELETDIYKHLTTLFDQTPYAAISLDVDNENATIVNVADAKGTPSDKSLIGLSIPLADGIKKIADDGITTISNFQVLSEFSSLTPYFGRRGCLSLAILPVFEGKSLQHLLAIGARDAEPITAQRIQPYEVLTEAIGTSLERVHLIAKLGKREKELSLIDSVGLANIKNTNLIELCINLHDKAKSMYGEDVGFCVAINDAENQRVSIPYYNDHELINIEEYDYSNDLLSQLIKSQEKQFLTDAFANGQYAVESPAVQRLVKSWIGYPMFIGGKVIGAVGFFSQDQANAFDLDFQKVTALLSSQISLSISDHLIQQEFEKTKAMLDQEIFLFDSLMNNIPVHISFKNTKNEFIRVSKAFANFLGFNNPSDLSAKLDDFRYIVEDETNNIEAEMELISTQTPVMNKLETWKKRNGETESLVSNKIPLTNEQGDIFGLLNISENVTERIKAEQLARHMADQLLTASEIAKDSTAGSMDVQVTLARLVELIRSRFGFYHSSIFLIDPLGKNAVLRESTGEAGAQMKSAGHKLAVGSPSIVGQATGKGVPVVIGDVTKEENYFANPLLPDTRSELAIPLKIGDKVLGALDVQSKLIDAFSPDDINILQVLADQIAVAIQNADLYTHTNQNLTRYRLLHQITSANVQSLSVDDAIHNTIEILHQAMPTERISYFNLGENNLLIAMFSAGYSTPDLTTRRMMVGQGAIGTVAKEKKPIRIDDAQADHNSRPLGYDTNSILAVPVVFADQLLGVINVEGLSVAQFDDSDQEFVTTLADNMASIISNIRLLDQVREQVDRQRNLFEITNKIRRSLDIETIMQTSVSEICNTMNIPRATIKISSGVSSEGEEKEKGS
jgi:PAS domain S-box-containing protein